MNMSEFEIILALIFTVLTILLGLLSLSALQLIKELKISLRKINKTLDQPETINPSSLQRLADTLDFSSPNSKSRSPRLFHRQGSK